MKATKAIHQLGDISRDVPEWCSIIEEDDENFYGVWVEGFGFYDVKFPKETTKPLTEEECKEFANLHYVLAGNDLGENGYPDTLKEVTVYKVSDGNIYFYTNKYEEAKEEVLWGEEVGVMLEIIEEKMRIDRFETLPEFQGF